MKPFTKRLALVMGLLFTALILTAPLQAVNNDPDGSVVNAERPADFSLWNTSTVKEPDGGNQWPAQFGAAVLLPAAPSSPTLLVPVVVVVRGCAEEQMDRIGAGTVIAGVENTESLRDRPTIENPRASVSGHVARDESAKFTISTFSGDVPSPPPAMTKTRIVWMNWAILGYETPETFSEGFGKPLRLQVLGGNRWLHSVSDLIVCHALGCLNSAREQLRLDSQAQEVLAI